MTSALRLLTASILLLIAIGAGCQKQAIAAPPVAPAVCCAEGVVV